MTTENSEELKDVELWEWCTWLRPPKRIYVEGKLYELSSCKRVPASNQKYNQKNSAVYRRIHDRQLELDILAWATANCHGAGTFDSFQDTTIFFGDLPTLRQI